MSSILNRFKGGTVGYSPYHRKYRAYQCALQTNPAARGAHGGKKDANVSQATPLERLIADAGPIREDGGDKFFGMENVCSGLVLFRFNDIG